MDTFRLSGNYEIHSLSPRTSKPNYQLSYLIREIDMNFDFKVKGEKHEATLICMNAIEKETLETPVIVAR